MTQHRPALRAQGVGSSRSPVGSSFFSASLGSSGTSSDPGTATEVFFDFLEVFALGCLLVGQLRPVASELNHASRLRLGAWSPSPHPATGISCMSDLPRP